MSTNELVPGLGLSTLLIVLAVAAVIFLLFMRRRSNRHPMEGERERNVARDIDQGRDSNA